MAQALTMPKLGMTMESGRVVEWKKEEGAQVARGEIILVVETEKVQYEVESPASGVLHILAPADAEAALGTTLALIAADRAEFEALAAGGAETRPVAPQAATEAPPAAPAPRDRIPIAPAARRLAEERGIDIRLVRGTGPGGRITREDVERHGRAPTSGAGDRGRVILLERTELRRTVARRMVESLRQAAQTSLSNDVDATALEEFRRRLAASAPIRITVTDILMKLAACALQQHPIINSRYTEEGDRLYRDVHMGMAMSVRENELVVPVIRDIDKKSLTQIAAERADYIERGRQGRLTMEELSGSTFTLSSLGMLGAHRFVAVLNPPENAILAVGAMLQKPWVHEGRIAIRTVMNLTLSYDHRTIYGAEAARFMATLQRLVEDPAPILQEP